MSAPITVAPAAAVAERFTNARRVWSLTWVLLWMGFRRLYAGGRETDHWVACGDVRGAVPPDLRVLRATRHPGRARMPGRPDPRTPRASAAPNQLQGYGL